MDLLVHLAARCKVSPSGHTLQVRDEETGKVIDFKASQTIGSLGSTQVYIVSKKQKPDWTKAASKAGKAAKAFEVCVYFFNKSFHNCTNRLDKVVTISK